MATKKEYADIKAGVDGLAGDPPAPPGMEEAPTPTVTVQEEMPEEAVSTYTNPAQQPAYTPAAEPAPLDLDRVHAIIEATVREKWDDFLTKIGDIAAWKERTNMNVLALKQEMLRTNERFTNLQNAVLGRVKTYDQGIQDIHTEMKALERVFERIVEPLTTNIKDLTRITQELKKINKK